MLARFSARDISKLKLRNCQGLLFLSRAQQEGRHLQGKEREALGDINPTGTLILDSQAPEL